MNLSQYSVYLHGEIAKHLGQPVPIGIYAGFAISSILLGKLWNMPLPVFDRFERYLDYPDPIEDKTGYVFRFTRPSEDEPDSLYNGYSIVSSAPHGNLITRRCFRLDVIWGEEERAVNLLRGLGVNAMQVAYCFDGKGVGTLYATGEFEQFVRTRQAHITCPVEGKTFLELAKVQDLFGAYVDWEEEALLMSAFRKAFSGYGNAYDDELVIEHKLLMDKNRNWLWRYCNVNGPEQLVLPGFEETLHARWGITFYSGKESETIDQIRIACNCTGCSLTSYTFTHIFNILLRKSINNKFKQRFWRALDNKVSSELVMRDTGYLRSDFSSKHLHELARFESQHPQAMKLLASISNDFISIIRSIRLVKKLGRMHGNPDFVIGLLEQAQSYGMKVKEISEQGVEELIAAYSSVGGSKLVDAADLSEFIYRDAFTELTTSFALRMEGLRCYNCVGGYAGAVSKAVGRVRIFHVHTKEDNKHATAAIYFCPSEDSQVEFELRGPRNSEPTEQILHVTNALAGYLLDTIWRHERVEEEQAIDFDTEQ